MSGRRVVVVGDVGLDVLVRPAQPVARGGDTPATVHLLDGGAGGNTAAWLAYAGAAVTLVARVGADATGRGGRARLEDAGVRCRFAVDPVLATCTVVVLAEGQERTMLPDRGASAALAPEDIRLAEYVMDDDEPGHLHVSGFVLLDERTRAAGLAALAEARRLGWTTSVDPQAANHLAGVGADVFLEWVTGVDVLLPNAAEAEVLGGDAAALRAVDAVATSAGDAGARWVSRAGCWSVPAPVVTDVEPTGCGDAFDAGLIAAWTSGATPVEALALGVALGSAAAARVGGRP